MHGRRKRRKSLKKDQNLNKENIVDIAKRYFGEAQPAGGVAVISSEERLQQVNEKIPENPLKLEKI